MRQSLTERERRFVESYMGEAAGNATKAAIRAGYSRSTARKQGSRLLTKGNIRAAIEERTNDRPEVWDRERRQSFWTEIASDESIPVRERLKASELLARSQGDFVEKRLLELRDNGAMTLAELIVGADISRASNSSSSSSESPAGGYQRTQLVSMNPGPRTQSPSPSSQTLE